MSPRATLIFYFKETIQNRYVLEQSIHAVPLDSRYSDGVKYRLVLADMKTGNRVLMDKHHPKGPHVHLGEKEVEYHFIDDQTLLSDFKNFVFQHMGVKL